MVTLPERQAEGAYVRPPRELYTYVPDASRAMEEAHSHAGDA